MPSTRLPISRAPSYARPSTVRRGRPRRPSAPVADPQKEAARMSVLLTSCLEVGCCSFDAYSDAASSGSGPAIKASSVTGTKLCKFAVPTVGIPADKVDAYDDWSVELLSITRGVPSWSGSVWAVAVDFLLRVTPACSICTSTASVDFTVSETFNFQCDSTGKSEVFRAENKVGFLDQSAGCLLRVRRLPGEAARPRRRGAHRHQGRGPRPIGPQGVRMLETAAAVEQSRKKV